MDKTHAESRSTKAILFVLLSMIFSLIIAPLVLKEDIDIYDARDEVHFHYPAIVDFADQFPDLDLVHYRSATTPLYHILFALGVRLWGRGIIPLRFLNAMVSLLCLLVVCNYFFKQAGIGKGLFFTALFMLSPYFVGPAIRLSTDNAALLFALLAILSMRVKPYSIKKSLVTNVYIGLSVLTRQIYLFLVPAYALLCLIKDRAKQLTHRWQYYLIMAVIPVIGILPLFVLWKGITPPRFAEKVGFVLSWELLVYIISLVGFYGIFFALWLLQAFKQSGGKLIVVLVMLVLGVGFLLLFPVSNEYPIMDKSTGSRGGALWLVGSRLPSVCGCASLFLVLFPTGLINLYVISRHLASRKDYLLLACFPFWGVLNMFSKFTYQKYYEPFLLFCLGYVMVSLIPRKWYAWIGPAFLLMINGAILIQRFY